MPLVAAGFVARGNGNGGSRPPVLARTDPNQQESVVLLEGS